MSTKTTRPPTAGLPDNKWKHLSPLHVFYVSLYISLSYLSHINYIYIIYLSICFYIVIQLCIPFTEVHTKN